MFQLNILKNSFKRIFNPLFLSYAIYLLTQWWFFPLKERKSMQKIFKIMLVTLCLLIGISPKKVAAEEPVTSNDTTQITDFQ